MATVTSNGKNCYILNKNELKFRLVLCKQFGVFCEFFILMNFFCQICRQGLAILAKVDMKISSETTWQVNLKTIL
jgi:hypothetical protein